MFKDRPCILKVLCLIPGIFLIFFASAARDFRFEFLQDSTIINKYLLPSLEYADSLLKAESYDKAIRVAGGLIDSVGNDANYLELSAHAYLIIAKAYKNIDQPGNALKNYLFTLQSLKYLDNDRLVIAVYEDLGGLYYDWGLIKKSIEYYQYAYEKVSRKAEKQNQINLGGKLTQLYMEIGEYQSANTYLSDLLKIYEQENDISAKIQVFHLLTDNYLLEKEYDKAVVIQNQLLQIYREAENRKDETGTINKIAHIYLEQQKYDPAIKYFRVYYDRVGSRKYKFLASDEKALLAHTEVTFGKLMEQFGDGGEPDNYRRAIEYYQEGLDIYLELNHNLRAGEVFLNIGQVFFKLKDYRSAINYCENAIALTETIPDYAILMNSHDILSQCYEIQERYKSANFAMRQYMIYKDSVFHQQMAYQLSLLKKASDYSNSQFFIHKIEQIISEEEMNNLSIARLELQAEKNRSEIELLAAGNELHDFALKNKELEKEKVISQLELVNQKYLAEKQQREIENLEQKRELQTMELRQQMMERKEKEKEIAILEQEKQLKELELEKADAQRSILILGVIISVITLLFLLRSYYTTRKSRLQIARKNAQIEFNNKKLKELNEEKNRLIRIVAHDLRNPLTSAITLTGILKNIENDIPEEYSHSLQLVRRSLHRMQEMIIKILDIKAIEEDKINLEIEPVNLKKLGEYTVELFLDRARNKEIKFITEMPEVYAMADRSYMIQVLENLLSNAIKYSYPATNIYLKIEERSETCRIVVRDEGQGFNDRDLLLLFNENQQFSSVPTGGESSNGLGLSIVKKYVDAMNGQIWCESRKGYGTTFTIELKKSLVVA